MKIRIKGNTLRYRLTRSDVNQFEKEGYLEDRTGFAGQPLIYALKRTNGEQLSAIYQDHTITLQMPISMLTKWMDTDIVGFENNDGKLYLLIEKDFTCMDNVSEDQSDNYPNPLALKSYE